MALPPGVAALPFAVQAMQGTARQWGSVIAEAQKEAARFKAEAEAKLAVEMAAGVDNGGAGLTPALALPPARPAPVRVQRGRLARGAVPRGRGGGGDDERPQADEEGRGGEDPEGGGSDKITLHV